MILLSMQDKKILVMRMNDETLEDIADEFNITVDDVRKVFVKLAEQIKTTEAVIEMQNLMNSFPYSQTRKKQRRILDGITKDNLVEYAVEYFPDEVRERLNTHV